MLNGSIYRIDWADMQSPTFRDYAATQGRYQQSGRSLINIGESEVIGIEAMGIYADVFDDRAIVWQTPNHPGWPSRPDIRDWRDQFVAYYAILRPRTLALSVSVGM
ncbi:MAG: hypothetical protein OXH15_19525 [Gammaproteobacteria bacterium]|nr:hypothetical protein [Gammaproteobacteria bacterium]